ncbi:hypothetical protein BJ165DRAFT_1008233 [Panaeolus papilionaceus]|nr:hypothetical protein BJ165DRAFT_1008233 [Panaeolus papilionaceus]
MSSPVLPPELERKIFEMAFDPLERSNSSRMMLVARRSRIWIRPLVYAIFDQRRAPTYSRNPFPNLKKLPPSVDLEEIFNTLIYQCPNLVNLALWGGVDVLYLQDSISSLDYLQRLSVTFRNIQHNDLQISTVFRSLTHLELFLYPNLTGTDNYQKWETLITSCPQICVFLFCFSTDDLSPGLKRLFNHDPRVVFVDYQMNDAEDWHRGALGLPDVWVHASRVVIARRDGYFKSNNHTAQSLSQNIPWLDYLTEEGRKWFRSL